MEYNILQIVRRKHYYRNASIDIIHQEIELHFYRLISGTFINRTQKKIVGAISSLVHTII